MKRNRITYNCDYCGKEHDQKVSEYIKSRHHFCSNKCKSLWQEKKILVKCEVCGRMHYQKRSVFEKHKHHYCSQTCSAKGNTILNSETRECAQCGNIFTIKQSSPKRFCSVQCQLDWQRTEERREHVRTKTIKMLNDGVFSHTNSTAQIIANEILDEMNIFYTNEYRLGRFSMDNYLQDYNLFIEVNGDYWHCSPIKYNSPTNDVQRKAVEKDQRKNSYINETGNHVLYLWEKDLHDRKDVCSELVKLYVNNVGKLNDYNSFNYDFDDNGNIKLNDILIKRFYVKSPV